jgi:hypothetical protein
MSCKGTHSVWLLLQDVIALRCRPVLPAFYDCKDDPAPVPLLHVTKWHVVQMIQVTHCIVRC